MGKKKDWKMPEWMEPYREMITNTGGNDIEELMNDTDTSSFNNVIRYAIIVAVESQIGMLMGLHNKGLLKE